MEPSARVRVEGDRTAHGEALGGSPLACGTPGYQRTDLAGAEVGVQGAAVEVAKAGVTGDIAAGDRAAHVVAMRVDREYKLSLVAGRPGAQAEPGVSRLAAAVSVTKSIRAEPGGLVSDEIAQLVVVVLGVMPVLAGP